MINQYTLHTVIDHTRTHAQQINNTATKHNTVSIALNSYLLATIISNIHQPSSVGANMLVSPHTMTPYKEQQETGNSYAANYITIITTVIITNIKTCKHSHFNTDCYLIYCIILCCVLFLLLVFALMLHLYYSAGFEIRHSAVQSTRN